jgi:hypothetical protein
MSKSANIALDALDRHPHFFVFPIHAGRKEPISKAWNTTANTNDPTKVKLWEKQYPGCNWGVVPGKSHLIPVDIDCKPGKRGADTRADLEMWHDQFPQTFAVQTPSGGYHLYYDETDAARYYLRLGKSGFGPDIDCPAQVLLPGSRTVEERNPDGTIKTYAGVYSILDDVPIVPAPAWFAEYLRPSNNPPHEAADTVPVVDLDQEHNIRRALHFLTHDARSSIEGRNGEKALFDTAAILKDLGISEDLAVVMIGRVYNVPKGDGRHPYCDPLWSMGDCADADSLPVKVHNAYTYATENPPGCDGFSAAEDFDDVEEFAP